eukprot:RCo003097
MSDIVFVWSRPVKELGRPPDFSEHPAQLIHSVRPNPALSALTVLRDPCETEIQCIPEVSEQTTNTERIGLATHGQLHLEGGWPKDIDLTEAEHKARYRRKTEKDDAYVLSMKSLAAKCEGLIKSNNAIDIYEEFFESEEFLDLRTSGDATDSDLPPVRTQTMFSDPFEKRCRTPVFMSWAPADPKRLAVAYCDLSLSLESSAPIVREDVRCFVWDVTYSISPETWIDPPSPLSCLQYSHKDTSVLMGGSHSGILFQFDVRQKGRPVVLSSSELSHRRKVTDIQWNQSKFTEVLSLSTDGSIMVWDTKSLAKPVEVIPLRARTSSSSDSEADVYSGTTFDCNLATGGSSKIMVGTEEGAALLCSRRARTPQDRVSLVYPGHLGPVYSVERNLSCPKYFLTVGDWRVNLWMEELRTPILTTKFHDSMLCDARWHPHRPGVFFTSRLDGSVDVWDLMSKKNDSHFSVRVSEKGLLGLRVCPSGQFLAVGGCQSNVFLLELSESLRQPVHDEKLKLAMELDRETVREKRAILRQKERLAVSRKTQETRHDGDTPYEDEPLDAEKPEPLGFGLPSAEVFNSLTADYLTSLEAAGIDVQSISESVNINQLSRVLPNGLSASSQPTEDPVPVVEVAASGAPAPPPARPTAAKHSPPLLPIGQGLRLSVCSTTDGPLPHLVAEGEQQYFPKSPLVAPRGVSGS